MGIPNAICYSLRLAPGWLSIFLVITYNLDNRRRERKGAKDRAVSGLSWRYLLIRRARNGKLQRQTSLWPAEHSACSLANGGVWLPHPNSKVITQTTVWVQCSLSIKTCVFISGREHNYYPGFWSHSKNVSFLGLLYIWPHSQSMLKWLQVKSLMAPSPSATFPILVQTWRMLYVHLGGCTIYRSTPLG